jgi:protein-disulfide isomerase
MFAIILAGVLVLTGCTREVAGLAQRDPTKPGVALSEDGYGIVTGFPDAAARVDFFTEPQCEHCAALQSEYGDDIAEHIEAGRLAVTYRPVTFLDFESFGYSARVSNALFLAVDPATSAAVFQQFVQELYRNQDPLSDGPDDDEIADMARDSGIPAAIVERIGSGRIGVDVAEMADANYDSLIDADSGYPGTPTIYDLESDEVVDIYESDWLDDLVEG